MDLEQLHELAKKLADVTSPEQRKEGEGCGTWYEAVRHLWKEISDGYRDATEATR